MSHISSESFVSDQHCSDCCNDFIFVSGCKEQLLNSSSLLQLLLLTSSWIDFLFKGLLEFVEI